MNASVILMVAGVLAGGVIGGGAFSAWWLRGLKEELRGTFATTAQVALLASTEQLNGVGSRVNALETVATNGLTRADEAYARTERLEMMLTNHIETMTEHVVKPLERISERLEKLASTQEVQSETLRFLAEGLKEARSENTRRSNQPSSRRSKS